MLNFKGGIPEKLCKIRLRAGYSSVKGVRKGEGSTQGSVCVKVGGEVGQPIVGSDPRETFCCKPDSKGDRGC